MEPPHFSKEQSPTFLARKRRRLSLITKKNNSTNVNSSQSPHQHLTPIPNSVTFENTVNTPPTSTQHQCPISTNHRMTNILPIHLANKENVYPYFRKNPTTTPIPTTPSMEYTPFPTTTSKSSHPASSSRPLKRNNTLKTPCFTLPLRQNLINSFNQTILPHKPIVNAPFNLQTTSQTILSQSPHYAFYTNLGSIDYSNDDTCSQTDSDNAMEPNSDSDEDQTEVPIPNSHDEVYSDIGDPVWECTHCGAYMWYQERKGNSRHTTIPKFSLCCKGGKIVAPLLVTPPPLLNTLLFDPNLKDANNFQNNIRTYNAMFSFTSPGMKFDTSINEGGGPPTLRLHGQTCHRIGSLLPEQGQIPKYAQLYIFDTDNEVNNIIKCFKDSKNVDRSIVTKLKLMLDEYNPHAKAFRMARDMMKQTGFQDLKLKLISERSSDGRVYNHPTVSEVAALIVGDVDTASKRDIVVQHRDGHLQRIDEFHSAYLSYQYPMIFPYEEDGYRDNILHKFKHEKQVTKQNRQTIKDWLCFRLQERKNEARTLLHSRRLFQQFLVDGYTMMESERLNWLRKNQSKLRVGKYTRINEQCESSQQQAHSKTGRRVVLPSSFVGSKRYMDQLYFDGMAISSAIGFPDLFITFTCNPKWPEITRHLSKRNLNPADRPDIVSKVFKMKFDELMVDITKRHVLGKVLAYIYTIEFQKRGLPHAHILIFLHPQSKYPTPPDIDNIISAEIPDPQLHPRLYQLVKTQMMHGPCGLARPKCPCMKNGRCSKFFPKKFSETTIVDHDGYPVYKRSSQTFTVTKNGITLDNRSVVPYNTRLLLKYDAHINMEWCNQSTSIKYLFKYIHKGYDRITASVSRSRTSCNNAEKVIDEIKEYLDCRYVSPAEACWRLFSYKIHGRKPAVERMFYYLIGEKPLYYTDFERMENVLEKASITESMFTSWLLANDRYEEAQQLTYGQFVSKFVYVKKTRSWKPRKKGFTIGRLIWVPPTTGELYYLRMMLTVVKGPKTYEDICKVGDRQYDSFRDACFAMGFLEDDREYIGAIKEASHWGSRHFLHKLFVVMLLSGTVNRPANVWKKTWILLSDALVLTEEQTKMLTLIEIEILLQANRRSLKDFKPIPYPDDYVLQQLGNRLIYEERNYDIDLMRSQYHNLFTALTGGVFFLHGYGGTGKTYMWKTLATAMRCKHRIVLIVASSGIASLLLPGGRTAHSKFKLPVPTLENSTCNIEYNDEYGQLLGETDLIIWDEAPMASKYCFEALDKTLKDVMSTDRNSEVIFGGKVVVFGGDFRQILHFIPRGSRSDIVHATINVSYIWHSCQVLTLTKNMRLKGGRTDVETKEIDQFSKWLLKLGEGRLCEPNDGHAEIDIPRDMLIEQFDDPIVSIVDSTCPAFLDNFRSYDYLKSRAILASTIEVVEQINNHVLNMMP
ncbi:uncharacterized protein LOC131632231, partial [Vicia villosa]|uniref:uncharacterized protein LOC131632231 n=1 Tax=Vicia villosa TaxID=3911 RepID=UPI00273C200D